MADDITYTSSSPAGVPNSTKQATDEHATRGHMPIVKLAYSADGIATHVPADADGLQVNLGANNDVTVTGSVTANAGTNLNTSALALESGGNLADIKTAIQILDNFISGSKGLVTEDNSASILTAVQTIDNFISGSRGLVTEDNSAAILTALQTIDNFISGSRGLVTEDNSANALTALQLIDDVIATLGTTTYSEATTKGAVIGAVRRDADTTLVDTTNEIGPLQMDANGRLKVEAFSGETLPVSLASVPSHAVTNAGTFAVQVDAALPAGDNNIGNVDLASAIPAGTNNIGDVDILTIAAGDNNIGNVDLASAIPAGDNAIGRVKLTDGTDVADVLDLTSSNPLAVAIVDGDGAQITSFGGGTQYTEGGTDASITGTAILWEDESDTLRAASAAKPLPVEIIAGGGTGGTSAADDADFTDGTTAGTPAMGVYEATPSTVTDGDLGVVGITEGRRLKTSATIDAALPAGTNGIGKLTANSGVDIGDVDILSIAAGDNNIGNVDIASIAAGDNNIGNVDVASSALPTGASTLAEQQTQTTALQLIDDIVYVDDTATHSTGSSKGALIMAAATPTDGSVSANDIGAVAMTTDRKLHVAVMDALPAGTNGIGKLTANSGVDIGDVDVTTLPRSQSGPGNPGTAVDSYTHAAINIAAGADTVLVSSAASKQIWVYGIGFTLSVAGTVSFQDEDNTAITGVMPFAALSGMAIPPSGNFSMPIWKLGTDKDLEVDLVTADMDGWIDYAIISV